MPSAGLSITNRDKLEKVQWKATEMMEGAGATGEEKAQGILINVYKYLKGGCRRAGVRILAVVPSDRTRAQNGTQELPSEPFSLWG